MASAHLPELRPRGTIGVARNTATRLRAIEGGQAPCAADFAPPGLGDLLGPGSVALRISAAGQREVLSTIAEMAGRGLKVKAARVFDCLMEREAAGSTGVGHGVALPHARVAGLEKLGGLFLRLSAPVEFQAVDDQPVDLVFALLAPTDCGAPQLRALARVARLLRDRETRRQLRAAPDVAAIRAILAREARSGAA